MNKSGEFLLPVEATRPPMARRYNPLLVAVVLSVLAGGARWLLDPYLGVRVPFATFFIAIVVAVRAGGLFSSVLTMFIGLAWALAFWFPAGLTDQLTVVACIVYLVSALAIMMLGQQMLRAESLAEGRARELHDSMHVMRASQGRLQMATQMSGMGVFEWDVRNDRFEGENPEAYAIFGRRPEDPKLSMAEFVERYVHPDDADRVRQLLGAAMRPGARFEAVFRSRRDGDGWRWLDIGARFFFDQEGSPTHLIGVIADITERKELENSLRKMAADLSEADHRKDEFLATLAHELRNPLAPIRNGIEVLKRSQSQVAATQSVVGVMERQMGHLVRLVDDLIDVSRITRNKLELRKERIELGQVIQAAIEASRPLVEAKAHRLSLSPLPFPVHLDADLTRLVQVFTNLVNNAAKYTDRGGHISISAEREGSQVAVTVADNGSGIPVGARAKLFEMFTQLDRSAERAQGGLGIGLSMVKRLVEMHEGSVEISSEGDGQGTQATVRLPVVLSPGPLPRAVADRGNKALPRRRILVVDDNRDAADSLASVLTLMGNEVRVGNDGIEATELALEFTPDVVMLDIGMPRMNGYEACAEIRRQPANADAVIIAVTGWGQDEDRRQSELAGFNLHLTKPVDPAAVEALLASLPPPRK